MTPNDLNSSLGLVGAFRSALRACITALGTASAAWGCLGRLPEALRILHLSALGYFGDPLVN
jgi:hypothetical protein